MDEAQAHEAIALSFGLDSSEYVGGREEEAEAAFIGCDPTWLFLDRSCSSNSEDIEVMGIDNVNILNCQHVNSHGVVLRCSTVLHVISYNHTTQFDHYMH